MLLSFTLAFLLVGVIAIRRAPLLHRYYLLPRYYGPLQDPLVFHRFPGCSSYTASLLRRFRGGTRRASPVALRVLAIVLSLLTPPEWIAASVRCDHPCCLRRTVAGSASGATHFRGHICVHFRYGPMAHGHPKDDLVDRLQRFSFLPPCYPSRVGGGALTRSPPSAAQTARTVFPYAAFTKTQTTRYEAGPVSGADIVPVGLVRSTSFLER